MGSVVVHKLITEFTRANRNGSIKLSRFQKCQMKKTTFPSIPSLCRLPPGTPRNPVKRIDLFSP